MYAPATHTRTLDVNPVFRAGDDPLDDSEAVDDKIPRWGVAYVGCAGHSVLAREAGAADPAQA